MITFTALDRKLKTPLKKICVNAVKLVFAEITKYNINICFCSDEYILETNKDVLSHNYYTDIITFFYNSKEPTKDAELLISLDRVSDNAKYLNINFEIELARVVIHGCLHLLGFNDKSKQEQQQMRIEENKYIKQLFHVEQ